MTDNDAALERLADDPRYRALIGSRGRYGWVLSAVMLAAYLGFILLVAFAPGVLARPIAGGATTLGIPIGLGVILLAIVLTGLYVRRANAAWDEQVDALVRDFRA